MLSINFAVVIQIALFILIVLICGPLLIKPTLRLLEERRERTEGAREEARKLEQESDDRLGEIEESLVVARKEGQEEREGIRMKKVQEAEAAVTQARDEARKEIETMRDGIEKEKEDARATLKAEIEALAKDIATRLLGREVA